MAQRGLWPFQRAISEREACSHAIARPASRSVRSEVEQGRLWHVRASTRLGRTRDLDTLLLPFAMHFRDSRSWWTRRRPCVHWMYAHTIPSPPVHTRQRTTCITADRPARAAHECAQCHGHSATSPGNLVLNSERVFQNLSFHLCPDGLPHIPLHHTLPSSRQSQATPNLHHHPRSCRDLHNSKSRGM